MDIKTHPQVSARAAAESKKEERRLPTRSFKEVMSQKEPPRFPQRSKSVFDLAAKEKKKPEEKKSSPHESSQHGEKVQELAPQVVAEGMEVAEVTELSLEVASLVEEMADYIKIESENGVSKTTVKVGMAGTALEGSTIELDHYDTAPHSFNLQLSGTPEAQELFQAHIGTLQMSLNAHEALKGFQVHILQPILSEKSELFNRGRTKEEKKKAAKLKGVGSSPSSITKK